jgi:hypothetical protein
MKFHIAFMDETIKFTFKQVVFVLIHFIFARSYIDYIHKIGLHTNLNNNIGPVWNLILEVKPFRKSNKFNNPTKFKQMNC